jgi:SAM-dependent methyltransferase
MAAVNSDGLLGSSLGGRDVLCLAAGGGQQSAVFGVLGANVTVLDICETQLERDRRAAEHYGLHPTLVQGDMRDLSCFAESAFDVVWQAHSLNFVPDPERVFAEVARVIRAGGIYRLSCWSPHAHGACEMNWNGDGYVIVQPYRDGPVDWSDEPWEVKGPDGVERKIAGPKEFRHTLATLINGTAAVGFRILKVMEVSDPGVSGEVDPTGPAPEPGTWPHFGTVLPQWLVLKMRWEGPPETPNVGVPQRARMLVVGAAASPSALSE